jgi:hypothetical protein
MLDIDIFQACSSHRRRPRFIGEAGYIPVRFVRLEAGLSPETTEGGRFGATPGYPIGYGGIACQPGCETRDLVGCRG